MGVKPLDAAPPSGPNLTWEEFRVTRQAQDGIRQFGETAIRDAFVALAGLDGNDTISRQEAQGGAAPEADAARRFVAAAAGATIDDVGFRLSRAPLLAQNRPVEVRAAERNLGRALGEHGLFKPVAVTGYRSERHDAPTLTEVQLRECGRAELDRLQKPDSPELRTIAARFGVDAAALRVSYDEARETITVGTGAEAPARPVRPLGGRADFITHHNQALDAWDTARARGEIDRGNILVHVDSHSDMYHRGEAGRSIADYINRALVDGTVGEVYWVAPADLPTTAQPPGGPVARTAGEPYSFPIWVREGEHIQWHQPADPSGYRQVMIHVTDLEHLDAAPLRAADNVLLDIDLDYFSNSGHDTFLLWGNNPTAPALRAHLDAFTERFAGVRPALTTVCLSPEYTTVDDQQPLLDYFRQWFPGEDYIPNAVGTYRHRHNVGADEALFDFVRDNVLALDNRAFEPRLAAMLSARGFDDLAAAYRAYCAGELTREAFAAQLREASNDAAGV